MLKWECILYLYLKYIIIIGMDADGWRRILVSKNYGKVGKDLRTSIAKMTQNLCSREVKVFEDTKRSSIEAYTANRLIPLEKNPTGVRPIGIGEVLRRIIRKAIITELKPDLIECGEKINCRFSDLNCRFYVNCRFSYVNCRFSYVNCRLSYLNCRLSDINCRFSDINCRLSDIITFR